MRTRWTVLTMLVASASLMAAPAIGQEIDSSQLHPADRALVHGYDPTAMQLLWSTWLRGEETEDACEIQDGETYTYQVDEQSVVIESDDTAVPTEACQLTATDVRGPNGQVNHGTVVSSFVHALKEQGIEGGIGCYVRAIAQTDYGKGDQQVKISDVDALPDPNREAQVELTITDVDCDKGGESGDGSEVEPEVGRRDNGNDNGKGQAGKAQSGKAKGKPDWAGQPGPPPHAKGGNK